MDDYLHEMIEMEYYFSMDESFFQSMEIDPSDVEYVEAMLDAER